MNRTGNILSIGLLFVAALGALVYTTSHLSGIEQTLIISHPELLIIEELATLQRILWGAMGGIALLFGLALTALWNKPKQVVKYVEKIVEKAASKVEKPEEEGLQQAERIEQHSTALLATVSHDSIERFGESYLIALSRQVDIVQGIFYSRDAHSTENYSLRASYAYYTTDESVRNFKYGHGLPGQVAMNKQLLYLSNVPAKYLTIMSGLGQSSPKFLLIFPLVFEGECLGVVELACFAPVPPETELVLRRTAEEVAKHLVKWIPLVGLQPNTISEVHEQTQ